MTHSSPRPFADEVEKAVNEAFREPGTGPAGEMRSLLDEFAEGISRSGVQAEIRSLSDPRRFALYVFPEHRPASGTLMLSFAFDGDTLVVPGEVQRRFDTVEELKAYLLNFVKIPQFVESLQILKQRANAPVEARLRLDANMTITAKDVLVEVSAAGQEKIGNATPSDSIQLTVRRVEFPGNPQLDDDVKYAVLDTAGLIVDVQSSTVAGGQCDLTGQRRPRAPSSP